ncbi:hypothetical protein FHR81_000780 [Actinoalloteichus hoggarensis]|uniref:Uncharacterized protein n=1 Tax=Actinoalloteichus hoggarensis TaxID=1470176 RepID=A0A221W197_9PSEU|nr:hypothetical protein [Actinoalloteichus hoggarensis]ASO19542.1 hypothetical protein AHOG_09490 [Actinoalloteichus hoggarensis]MBB5919751.1 hypothetical protein [Actinoalloteichus hoggarensis]
MTVAVILLAGFNEPPFYYYVEEGRRLNWSTEEAAEYLGLSAQLVSALDAWDDEYQDTLDREYPPDSAFPTPEAYRHWIESGKALAARVKNESSTVSSVDYQADGSIASGTCVF